MWDWSKVKVGHFSISMAIKFRNNIIQDEWSLWKHITRIISHSNLNCLLLQSKFFVVIEILFFIHYILNYFITGFHWPYHFVSMLSFLFSGFQSCQKTSSPHMWLKVKIASIQYQTQVSTHSVTIKKKIFTHFSEKHLQTNIACPFSLMEIIKNYGSETMLSSSFSDFQGLQAKKLSFTSYLTDGQNFCQMCCFHKVST